MDNVMERPQNISVSTAPKHNRSHWGPDNPPPISPGRPKGTGNKLSVKSLLAQLSDTVGKPYEQQLAENYRDAILSEDRKVIMAYDNLFLSKLLADKISIEPGEQQEIVDAKRQAFMGALEAYGQAVKTIEHGNNTVNGTVITVDATVATMPYDVTHSVAQPGDGGEHGESR